LKPHGSSKRTTDQNDRSRVENINYPSQILFFMVAVGARIAIGLPMGATIVSHHIKAKSAKSFHHSGPAGAIIRKAMEIDYGSPAITNRLSAPSPQVNTLTLQSHLIAFGRRSRKNMPFHGMKYECGSYRRKETCRQPNQQQHDAPYDY
jgi:hypothetical protein